MKLNSPRKDPYSSMSRAEEELKEEGYTSHFTVMNEKQLQNKAGHQFQPEEVQLDFVVRLPEKKAFLSNENKSTEPKAIYAINVKDGEKGLVYDPLNKAEESKVIEGFLRNVDRKDRVKEFYTA